MHSLKDIKETTHPSPLSPTETIIWYYMKYMKYMNLPRQTLKKIHTGNGKYSCRERCIKVLTD